MNKRVEMLFRYLKRIESRIIMCAVPFIFMVTSCEQRDPQAEYELLCEAVYSSPQDGVDKAQEYIDYFYDTKGAKIAEVSEIRDSYRKIDAFFVNSFSSYADFLRNSQQINNELSYSKFNGVRELWMSLYESEKKRLLTSLLDNINGSDFDEYFQTQVGQLCNNEFNLWTVESIDQISLSTPMITEGGTLKQSKGEYRVNLRGNMFGTPGTAIISIEGTMGPDENGEITFNRTSYSFLRRPIINF